MTKRTLVVLGILAMLAVPAFAADSLVAAGSLVLAGGSNLGFDYLSYTYEPEEGDSTSATEMALGLYGKLGYFVIDSLAVGPILKVAYDSYTYEDLDPVTTTSYGGGLWVGYFFDLGSAFYPYVNLAFLFQGFSSDDPNTETTTTGSEYGPALFAGALINFAEGWALDVGLEFDYLFGSTTYGNSEDFTVDTTTMDIGLNVGLAVFF